MITSKTFANRSNAFRAARVHVDKSRGSLAYTNIKVMLGTDGYFYTIAESAEEAAIEVDASTPAEPVSEASNIAIDAHVAEVAAAPLPAPVEAPTPADVPAVAEAPQGRTEVEVGVEAGADPAAAGEAVVDFSAERAADEAAFEALSALHTKQADVMAVSAAAAQESVEAAAAVAAKPVEILTGEVMLCIALPAATSRMWAGQLSKKTGTQVTIRDGVTFAVKEVVEARAAKAARTKASGGGKPRVGGVSEKLAALMSQPGGATVSQLRVAAGWNTNPSSFYARKIAAARGMMLVLGKKGKEQTFALVEGGTKIAA